MAENNLGRNITFPIYNSNVNNLVIHKATVETSVMSLGDKITGDVYYANNSLQVTMQEYIVYNDVRYILVSPPTIIREGMVSENGELKGMTKYSFVFYHPMYVLSNFPFSDVAVSNDEKRYLSENKVFSWIGKPQDFIDKLNKNLEGTEWIVVKSSNFPQDTEDELSDVLKFDNNTIADALKTGYETWGLPYVIDQIHQNEQGYSNEKKFKVIFGLPSNAIMDGQNEYVFRMGQGVGLKNNSRTPRNNKIVTRIAGYGSENNIPYGYPQIQWYGNQSWTNTKNNPNDPTAYPIYDGIVGGRYVKLIKHPFTRNHLMPSVYRQKLFNKVSPYLSDGSTNSYYNPDIELVDYYDANTENYPNQINLSSPSYEIHAFEDIKPELGEAKIVGVQPIKNDGTDADGWDDTMDDDGNYLQSYFKLTLPQLDFDMYACAAITEEMQINMRSGACIGCTFPVQVDWEDYKKSFYDDDGNFDPAIGEGHPRNASKYPDSSSDNITVIVQKEYSTFGVLMPNIYQQPASGDEFVILGISLPDTYVTNAEGRLDDEMQAYMLANNVHYYDYPLKFDEYFLATHTDILSQIRTNTQVKFQFANEDPMTLFVKQIVIKYGENTLPQYDITLTDSVEVVLNQIGKVADDVEKLSALVSVLRQSYNRNVWGEIAKKLSKTSNDTAQGEITFLQGLKIGSNGNNGIAPNGDATLNDVNVSGDLTITHVETPQGGVPIVKEYGITNDGDISGEGLEIGNFANSGLLGTGGAFKMIDGKSYLEADKLYVRMKAYFDTLEIRRYYHTNGNRVASNASMKCTRVEWYGIDEREPIAQTDANRENVKSFKCYFRKTDGEDTITNDFLNGDLAFCETTNLKDGNALKRHRYWRRVVQIGSNDTEYYIKLSNEDGNYEAESDFPEPEDVIVQLGSATNEDRQGAIIEATSGAAQAPTYRIYQGINSFNLENKCKVDMGYDLETHRAYLNVFGDFYVGAEGNNPSTYIRYTQGEQPLLEIKAKIDATSGSPILNTINSKAQVYMNTVGTMSSVDYKAGDLWILPAAVGTYAAGTMLVAKSDKAASFNLNDWDVVEETEFNAYVAQIVGGGIVSSNPTDAQQAANKINAIKSALNDGTTTINGGLILTNLIALKNSAGGVTAGITGQMEGNDDIALWLGGKMADVENPQTGQSSFAKSLFRFDGSGYLAGGNISWKDNGDTTVKGTVRADNLYHGVCFFHEELGADHFDAISEPHVAMFSTRKHYINGVSHLSTGTCDVVFMIPLNSQNPWNKYGIDGTQVAWEHDGITADVNDERHGWPLDARTLTLPSPQDFEGKTIEVFIYSTGDEPQEDIDAHMQQYPNDDGWGEEKQIKIRSLKIGADGQPVINEQTGMPIQYSVVAAIGFDTNNGVPITRQEGDNYVVSKDPAVGYLRFQAAMCYNTKYVDGQAVSGNEYAWIMSTGMGGVNITNIEGDVIYSEGADKSWVNSQIQLFLDGAADEYGEPIEDPTQWDACLRLSAGINQCLTDSLFLQPNKAIKIKDGSLNGTDLLSFTSASGNTPAKWVLGTGANGVFRSGGELYRWVDNNTQYKIWDASNLTPSSYLLKTDISNWAKQPAKPTYNLDEVADGATRKLSNYATTDALATVEDNSVIDVWFNSQTGNLIVKWGTGDQAPVTLPYLSQASADERYLKLTGGMLASSSHQTLTVSSTAEESGVANWVGIQFGHGSGDSYTRYGGIRMDELNGALKRYTSAYTAYTIWDSGNFNPSNYPTTQAVNTAISTYCNAQIANVQTWADGRFVPLVGSSTIQGTLSFSANNSTNKLTLSNNKIQLAINNMPHNVVLFEGSTQSYTSYAKFYERPMVKTGTNNGTPVYTNVALVSEIEGKQNKIHFLNTKTSGTEIEFTYLHLPLDSVSGGHASLDLSDYATTSAWKVKDVQVVEDNSLVLNGEDVIYGAELASDGMLTLKSTRLSIAVPENTSDLVNDSGFITSSDLSNYWNNTSFKGVKVGNTPYSPQTNGTDAGWIDISDEFSSIGNTISGKVSKNGDSMTGNLTMITNGIRFKQTSNGNIDGAIMASNVTPEGSQSSVGCLRIGGVVNFYNDGTPPMLNGSYLATQLWANGRFVTALGTSGNYLTYAKNGSTTNLTVPFATQALRLFGTYISSGKINANTMTVNDTKYSVLANYYSTQNVWENAPNGMGYGAITELNAGSGVGVLSGQLAWDINHNTNTPTNRLWWRARNSTGWGDDWQQFVMYRYVGTGAVDTYAGTFAFGGSNAIQAGYDYAGLQVGYESDRWQITAIGSLKWRQNDNTDLTSAWQPWRTILDTSNWSSYVTGFLPLSAGSNNPLTDSLYMNNATYIYFKDTQSTSRNAIGINSLGDFLIGYGTSSAGCNTHLYGNNIYFRNGTSQGYAMMVSAGGNVGIGTTTPTENYKLDVNGATLFRGNATIKGSNGTGLTIVDTSATHDFTAFWNTHTYNDELNSREIFTMYSYETQYWDMCVGTHPNDVDYGGLYMYNSGNNALRWGIGTATPSYKLDVNGDIHTSGDIRLDSEHLIYFKDSDNPSRWCDALSHGYDSDLEKDVLYVGFGFSGAKHATEIYGRTLTLYGGSGSNKYLKINANGNVGIAIEPSYKLDVNGVAMVRGDIHMNGDLVFEDGNFPVTLMSGASGDANYAIAQFGLRPQVLTGANTYTNVALISDLSNLNSNMNINGDVSATGTISSEDYIKADSDVFVGDSLYFGTDYNAPRLYIDNGHLYFNGTRIA